ncbi:MAG: acylphosphatase [Fidelibacterota bacterium]
MNINLPKQENSGLRLVITGRVQMVGFRWFTVQWAQDLDLAGYVKNQPDGSVLMEAEGPKKKLENMIEELKRGPRGSSVDRVEAEWLPFEHRFRDFNIRY